MILLVLLSYYILDIDGCISYIHYYMPRCAASQIITTTTARATTMAIGHVLDLGLDLAGTRTQEDLEIMV